VFFQGDGVYNAVSGGHADAGTLDLAHAWRQAAEDAGCELLLCSSAWARRLPAEQSAALSAPYRVAGLAELVNQMSRAHRVVSF
jgi:sulfur relay (sulfurtransferase) complex TusBCD TusD component (DsrE family)